MWKIRLSRLKSPLKGYSYNCTLGTDRRVTLVISNETPNTLVISYEDPIALVISNEAPITPVTLVISYEARITQVTLVISYEAPITLVISNEIFQGFTLKLTIQPN